MSLTLINTASSATANAYVSLATCDLFVSESIQLNENWGSVSTANKEACIILATSLLDVQMAWRGVKASSTQALEFPRTDLYDRSEFSITSTDIPRDIQYGTAYYAYFLSQESRLDEDSSMGFSRLDAGSLRMDIDKYDRKPVLPLIVYDIIKWYGTRSSGYARVLQRR